MSWLSESMQVDCARDRLERRFRNDNTLTALSTLLFKKLNGAGVESPSCCCIPVKSIVLPSSRAGVPVCKRPSLNPAFFKDTDSPVEGLSPSLPAGNRFMPRAMIRISQLMMKNVGYQYGSRLIETFQCR